MSPPLLPQDITMTSEAETARDLLGELVAIVRGECPSLLNEDSGGSAELSMRIDAALSRAPEPSSEGALPLPREVECVTYESGFREPADPVWYLEVGGFVAEFSTELAANNFRSAVISALSRAPEAEELGSSTRMTSPASRSQTPLSAGWQDISSAPTMEAVLVYGGEVKYPVVASWTGLNDEPWTLDALGNVHDEIDWPTHWMPLPEPPADNSPSGPQRSELTRLAQDEPVSSPPSTGGEGEAAANQVGAAEAEVGRYVYRRIERLMDAKPGTVDGAELCYLAEIAEGVEEYGEQACDGHPLGRFPHPSPEMGEISREELAAALEPFADACEGCDEGTVDDHTAAWESPMAMAVTYGDFRRATSTLTKLKENGLSREELGGLAQSQPGAACPSDCAESGQPSQGGWAGLIAAEFAMPQFMTSTAGDGKYSLNFSFSGPEARERCDALGFAFRAAGLAINGDAP